MAESHGGGTAAGAAAADGSGGGGGAVPTLQYSKKPRYARILWRAYMLSPTN